MFLSWTHFPNVTWRGIFDISARSDSDWAVKSLFKAVQRRMREEGSSDSFTLRVCAGRWFVFTPVTFEGNGLPKRISECVLVLTSQDDFREKPSTHMVWLDDERKGGRKTDFGGHAFKIRPLSRERAWERRRRPLWKNCWHQRVP